MAEKNEDAKMSTATVPEEPGSQDLGDDLQEDSDVQLVTNFRTETELVWQTVLKFLTHLRDDDEIFKMRREFCSCVKSIIEAYEGKIQEVESLNYVVQAWKKKSQDMNKEIQQLKLTNTKLRNQLASSVCVDCGKKIITEEQLRSLSMQEKKTESPEGTSEIDGGRTEGNMENDRRKIPREVEESNENALFQDSTSQSAALYKCSSASCGLDALFYMFYKMEIYFCPIKFIQMIGTVRRHEGPKCTLILNNVKDQNGHFLKRIYKNENIDKGKQQEVLKNAEAKFIDSNQKFGILSYCTDSCNHCVNIYKSEDGKMEIYDTNRGKQDIEKLDEVRYIEVSVLKCDEIDGILVPHIVKRWSKCHVRHCKNELKKLSKPGNSEGSLSEVVLKDNNREPEDL